MDRVLTPRRGFLVCYGCNRLDENQFIQFFEQSWGGGGRHERGTFFRLQELKKVEISLAEVHERVGKCTISVCQKAQKDWAHNQAVYLS